MIFHIDDITVIKISNFSNTLISKYIMMVSWVTVWSNNITSMGISIKVQFIAKIWNVTAICYRLGLLL